MPTLGQPSREPLRDLQQVEALRLATAVAAEAAVLLRTGIVDRLMVAQTLVPRALRLLVVAGHHAPATVGRCPHGATHATGAAVDLTAHLDGSPEPDPWSAIPPPDWPLLEVALTSVGMINTAAWWHWSFGDRDWQISTGADTALYGGFD
jgi:zinc D-Ala-D-Ala dipeptidase